ncbi:GNAT family N-acetyltransferase [Microbacterium amylolyticum]|uniref:Diamine N-acetyltransferase n=1 Tax=Microbacterium amylolyticum TaxID=936337 RepID=A0ABS4ZJI3_9MICO|nr:GNAT family N-acetyltransferase [Microbacterium amylolyticum]MBP2437436.1 diamine N-acetyltransferase [Microbacterium amylolyticum]
MSELHVEDLSAATIVAANSLTLKPGQEEFIAPTTYSVAMVVADPQKTWQRVILDGDEVVAFIRAYFDPDESTDYLRAALWRINVDAAAQGRGAGRFAVDAVLAEAKQRGFERLTVVYEAGESGPEAFFRRVGFIPVDETEYGEVVAEFRF